MTLRARVIDTRAVSEAQLGRMWSIFAEVYAEVDEGVFRADFRAKDRVILLEDGEIQGFSTLVERRVVVDGRTHVGMFSGDTVVQPEHWGTRVLGHAFLQHLARRRLAQFWLPYWWVLISKGYKTYLLMANNFPEHWPRHERPTPEPTRRVLDAFGQSLFAAAWHPEAGVVRWETPRGRLKAGVAEVTPDLAATHPRVAFFADRNPGWAAGDELMCLARMELTLPIRYAWKAARRAMP